MLLLAERSKPLNTKDKQTNPTALKHLCIAIHLTPLHIRLFVIFIRLKMIRIGKIYYTICEAVTFQLLENFIVSNEKALFRYSFNTDNNYIICTDSHRTTNIEHSLCKIYHLDTSPDFSFGWTKLFHLRKKRRTQHQQRQWRLTTDRSPNKGDDVKKRKEK